MDGVGLSVVDLVWCHQTDTGVMMIAVIPVEKMPAEYFCVFDAAEALWKLRLIFQGFAAALRERIVIRRIRPAV